MRKITTIRTDTLLGGVNIGDREEKRLKRHRGTTLNKKVTEEIVSRKLSAFMIMRNENNNRNIEIYPSHDKGASEVTPQILKKPFSSRTPHVNSSATDAKTITAPLKADTPYLGVCLLRVESSSAVTE